MITDQQKEFYYQLRLLDFRLDSSHVDHHPHMTWTYDTRTDCALEISCGHNEWLIWARSDLAHHKARFIFLRRATKIDDVIQLMEALRDSGINRVKRDRSEFMTAIEEEEEDCIRRRQEYCNDDRYPHTPG